MASSLVERPIRRASSLRTANVSLHPAGPRRAPVVLIVDPDERRRRRQARALAPLPCRIAQARASSSGVDRAADDAVAVAIFDGRKDPFHVLELARRIVLRHPSTALIFLGLESRPRATMVAVNTLCAFRVLAAETRIGELKRAVLSGLRAESDRRHLARLDRTWVRTLVRQIEASLPPALLASIEERGGDLPVDLIVRPTRA